MARALLPRDLPVARWLEYYATRFDTVEINNSFYRLPDRSTFANWRTHVPPAFLFAVKGQSLSDAYEAAAGPGRSASATVLERVRFRPPARSSPLSTSADSHARPAASRPVSARPASKLERHTFTRRGVQTSVVVSRTPSSSSGGGASRSVFTTSSDRRSESLWSDRSCFVRFHGTSGHYHGSYSRRQLDRWAHVLAEQIHRGRRVFAYFNNDPEAVATANALTLREKIDRIL